MSRRHLVTTLIVGSALGLFAMPAQAQQSCQLGNSVVLAINSARTGTDVAINGGDVVVNQAFSGIALGDGFSLYIDRRTTIQNAIKADRIRVFNQSTISGGAFFNQLTNDGVISGGQFTPLSLPVFGVLPPFQEATFRGTPGNVSVPANATVTLAAGEYGNITVAGNGHLVFTGGVYHVKSIDAIADNTFLTFNAAAEIRIAGKFRTRRDAIIGPASGSGITATNIVFYVGGINGSDGQLNSAPEAARIGSGSVATANFYVPNGTLRLETSVTVTGALLGRDVQIDSRAVISRQSAFTNRAPTAAPQDLVTSGADPLTITLTASDPENGDLVFAIQGSGLQFPSRGSLGALIQASPPFPGNPPGCNPDNVPGCVPPGAPRSSATITYTPSTAANEENSFTFSATDACGNTGMATVRINPPGDPTNPPAILVVDASNVAVETPTNTPRGITLVASGPTTATLTFSVESLPAHGSLTDSAGTPITSVPYALPSRKVTYQPASAFNGLDAFLFKATGSVGGFDTATVTVNVAPRPELAQDQSVTTSVDTPIEISLRGNPGGTGTTGGGPFAVMTYAQTRVFPGAAIAGNVSDANNNGLGDARDNLPGPAPVLVAAGVDVNLASLPSGTVSDPNNDATASPNADPDPDLVSATVSSDGTNLLLQVRFKPGTFDSALTRAQFLLDTDRNPATGHPGSDSLCVNDNGIIGAEFIVDMGADLGATAEVLTYQGSCNAFSVTGSGTTTFVTDGMDTTVALSALGGSDGRVNFKVTTSESLGGSGFTGVLDYMPNVGLAAGEARVGIQGVARVQMEWDVSTLPGSEGIETAEVTLNTLKGTVDSLDTFFFAGTAEQDGVLAVTDFEAPASQITGVVMPVPAAPTGTEGTFVFNVTNQLKAARAAGRNFFSVQGRVNEALAGGGFKRGLQVRSTADGNLTAGKEPKLEVVTTPIGPGLTFTITALPGNGVLRFGGSPVVVNQTFSTAPTLLYRPNLGFTGTDSFVYRVTEGPVSDLATVNIGILANPNHCEIDGRPVGCAPN